MSDNTIFLETALQYGYNLGAASAALAVVLARLEAASVPERRFYLYRTPRGVEQGIDPTTTPGERPRHLLAFQSADTALAFAQQRGLGISPRLVNLELEQLLAVLIQRPAITTLIVVDETAPIPTEGLPAGVRIERTTLLAMLIADGL